MGQPRYVTIVPDVARACSSSMSAKLGSEYVSSGDAHKLYLLVCEEYEVKPRSYTTFWKHLKTLETEGLIETRAANTNVGRGRTQHITMNNTAPATIESRIEREFLRG